MRYVVLALVMVTFLAVSLPTLNSEHNWGDDFSQYILHAQNLLHGRDYSSGIMMNDSYQKYCPAYAPRKYPPLFPLVLTPIVAFVGVDFLWLKVPNILFWMLWVAVTYGILKRMLGETHAVLLSLVLLFSPWFFRFKQSILSDVLFAFLVAAALLVYMKSIERRERIAAPAFGLFAVCLTLASLTRAAAHPVFLASVIYLSLFERKYLGATILAAVWILITIGGQLLGLTDTLTYTTLGLHSTGWAQLGRTWSHGVYIFSQTVCFLAPQYWTPHPVLLAVLLGLMMLGFVTRVRSNAGFSIIEVFTVIYSATVVAFPYRQGPRFVLPIVGILLAYSVIGLRVLFDFVSRNRLGPQAVTAALIGTLLYCAIATWNDRGFSGAVLKSPGSEHQLVTWMKANIAPDEHYLHRKPRALALLTGRTGLPVVRVPERVRNLCKEQGVRWVMLHPNWDADLIKSLRESPDFRYAWKHTGIHVFEFLPWSGKSGGP